MGLIEKINTLLNATLRSGLSPRERRSALDELEREQLEAIRRALAEVTAREREMVGRIQSEQAQAEAAAQRGDTAEQQAHQRRIVEIERRLHTEMTQAIDLEATLAALEEKLALAKEAVEKEAQKAADRDEAASKILDMAPTGSPAASTPAKPQVAGDDSDLAARKSRLAG
jgi:secreted Zn-dependent insulinase-like peptidase